MKIIKASLSEEEEHQKIVLGGLVEQMPSLMLSLHASCSLPPLAVLNDLFDKGELDEGMSGCVFWQPFQIDEPERQELKKWLIENHNITFQVDDAKDVKSYKEWQSKILKSC